MSKLEVVCTHTKTGVSGTPLLLNNVIHFDCSTTAASLEKLQWQQQSYGDGRITILTAFDTDVSEHHNTTWTTVSAKCSDHRNGSHTCYLFIEQHPNMSHVISFIYT